tara:strand:- start:193 stop:507 length:315 start_codon:yes stop_codon:yes gene_type:complete
VWLSFLSVSLLRPALGPSVGQGLGDPEFVLTLWRDNGFENELQEGPLDVCDDQCTRSHACRVLAVKHLEEASDMFPGIDGDVDDAVIQEGLDASRQAGRAGSCH